MPTPSPPWPPPHACHLDRSVPDFLPDNFQHRPRMRLSVKRGARSSTDQANFAKEFGGAQREICSCRSRVTNLRTRNHPLLLSSRSERSEWRDLRFASILAALATTPSLSSRPKWRDLRFPGSLALEALCRKNVQLRSGSTVAVTYRCFFLAIEPLALRADS